MTKSIWVVISLISLYLFAVPCLAQEVQTLSIGSKAPDFKLVGTDGMEHQLSDYATSKVLVVIFTCNHCPTAQAYEDRIIQLVNDYRKRGVSFVAISPNDPNSVRLDELGYSDLNDSLEEMRLRAEYKHFNLDYLFDGANQNVSRKFGPTATPHAFVFDGARRLRYRGRIDNAEKEDNITSNDLRIAIEALLHGNEVAVETTRPFGCSIKWSDKRQSVKDALEKWAKEEVSVQSIGPAELRELAANNSNNLRLINIWATWCGPCVVEFPDLVEVYRMYRNRAFEFISVSADDPEQGESVLAFLKKHHASNRNYRFASLDRDALMDSVNSGWSGALPHTILVEPGGRVIYRQTGPVNFLNLKRAIVAFLGRTY